MGREGDFFFLARTDHCSKFPFQAYRLEPLILKHYSNISPVQIHWYNTANPLPYEHMKPSFLNPSKEPTSAPDTESASAAPSPTTSPVMVRRHYGESITNIGKASILGNVPCVPGVGWDTSCWVFFCLLLRGRAGVDLRGFAFPRFRGTRRLLILI